MKKVIDLTGKRFGRLVVIREDSQRTSRGQIKWICQCDCGNIVSVVGGNLRNGHTQSCGCICKEKGRGKKDLVGQRFGRLTVIQEDPERSTNGKIKWICRCDCGNTVSVLGGSLRGGNTQSCGCLTRERIAKIGKDHKDDLTGKRFGRLTVVKEDPIRDGSYVKWICRCDCGNIISTRAPNLRSGNTLSCGCLQKEIVRKDVVDGTKVSTITPNRKPNSNNTSGKRGVYWDKAGQKWYALICFRKHSYYLGRTDDFKEACRMRDEAEEHFYGDFLKWYAEAYPEEWRRLNKKR